ncbi:capsular polysaccharide biosynthesis protein [Solirhodobacter olei]|uniref:capsular polysaccharide biosynthesis protein n=1 Tax=Solirhodobacter olei TaxID=2493082 RepID=UPI000FD87689|nr:capsular polysaccharide biosynthesis protein [Solirhodobacter olei]
MAPTDPNHAAGEPSPRRLFCYTGRMIRPGRIRRILTLAGLTPTFAIPKSADLVGTWGRSPLAWRGERMSELTGAELVRVEDAFLRSVRPGRAGDPPLGLMIDRSGGVHYDASKPSALERLLGTHPLDDSALMVRAREGIARLIAADLSKYNTHDPDLPAPDPGYVLVVDQTRGDGSVTYGGATPATFREMLVFAQEENPGARILIRAHPETVAGLRPGHYGPEDAQGRISRLSTPVSPWKLLEGAVAVYTVSSQLGFEAILAGHRPQVFGQPFYAGWGLTEDRNPLPRRTRKLTRAQLFAGAMLLAPTWYDPCRDRLCAFEEVLAQLEAQTRAFREDRRGHIAFGMRMWKRRHLMHVFGRPKRLRFVDRPGRALALARRSGRSLLVWAGKEVAALHGDVPILRVEDGFLRSRGLGADLIPPLSLVADDLGIYYDPARESRLERLIAEGPPPGGEARAERLIARILRDGISKYNLGGQSLPALPEGHRILVPGQVEDDASIRRGAGAIATNLGLLRRARLENPDAVILYKPHPDVEAGLRKGAVPEAELRRLADLTLSHADPAVLLGQVDEVWTMTSALGFEALLRGVKVTCLGTPFYAGWGLTRDLGLVPARRQARPSLAALAHAALIAYPRYFDPVSRLPCPPEVAIDRLATGCLPRPGPLNRSLAKLQGLFAGAAWIWR